MCFPVGVLVWGIHFIAKLSFCVRVCLFQTSKCFYFENPLLLTKWNTQVYDVMWSLSFIFAFSFFSVLIIFCCIICFGLNSGFVVVLVWIVSFQLSWNASNTQHEKMNLLQYVAFYHLTSIHVGWNFWRHCKMCEYNDSHNTYMFGFQCSFAIWNDFR